MSFLLETEGQATLAEALAFIDTFTPPGGSEASSAGSDPDSPLYVVLHIPQQQENRNMNSSRTSQTTDSSGSSGIDSIGRRDQNKLRKDRAANTRAVNRYCKRTKTEILELRIAVGQLNAQLHQRNIAGSKDTDPNTISQSKETAALVLAQTDSAVGFEDVLVEYRKLQESEALNRQLKDALARQRRVTSTLKSVLQNAVSVKDLGFVCAIEGRLQKKLKTSRVQDCARVYSELFQYLTEVVYDNTAAVLQQLNRGDTDCVFSNSMVKHDRIVGKMLELTSNTPLFCILEQLDAVL